MATKRIWNGRSRPWPDSAVPLDGALVVHRAAIAALIAAARHAAGRRPGRRSAPIDTAEQQLGRLQAGIEEDGEQRQRAADDDADRGVQAEQRDDVDGQREEQRAEQRAEERAAAAGQRRAAEHRRGDAGQRVGRRRPSGGRRRPRRPGRSRRRSRARPRAGRRGGGRSRSGRRCAWPPARGSRRPAA